MYCLAFCGELQFVLRGCGLYFVVVGVAAIAHSLTHSLTHLLTSHSLFTPTTTTTTTAPLLTMLPRQCIRRVVTHSHHPNPLTRTLTPTLTRTLTPLLPKNIKSFSTLGGLPSEFIVHPRTQQLIDDIDTTVLSFGHGQDYSANQEVEVTGNAMTLDSLIELGE